MQPARAFAAVRLREALSSETHSLDTPIFSVTSFWRFPEVVCRELCGREGDLAETHMSMELQFERAGKGWFPFCVTF
jgi:hypothetical protein